MFGKGLDEEQHPSRTKDSRLVRLVLDDGRDAGHLGRTAVACGSPSGVAAASVKARKGGGSGVKMGQVLLCAYIFADALTAAGASVGADGVVLRERLPGTNYCRLKFPAIREETLGTAYPVLKSPDSGDLIDFYGSCDEDPLGPRQVLLQQQAIRRLRQMERGN